MKKLLLTLGMLAAFPSTQARSIFDDFDAVFGQMERMMHGPTRSMMPQRITMQSSSRMNLQETDEALIVTIAAPGMSEEDFKIEVLENRLHVSGEQKQENKNMVSASSFTQVFGLPVPVKADGTVAHYDAGILTITMPKQEKAKPHTVAVKVSRPLKKQAEE